MLQKPRPQTVGTALQEAVSFLTAHGIETARLEAEVLLAHVLKTDRAGLFTRLADILTPEAKEDFISLLGKRGSHYPLQYLTGRQEFMSLDFAVTPDVLIPRPETEILVEQAVVYTREFAGGCTLCDVGTGSGAIAVSLAYYGCCKKVYAVDISPGALAVACQNAKTNRVEDKIIFVQGDLLLPFVQGDYSGVKFDLILSNPPYIPAGEISRLQDEVRLFEPRMALDGGDDGLNFYRRLEFQARSCLNPGGMLLLEIGWNQADQVREILSEPCWSDLRVIQDLAGRDRVITARYDR